jgi:hypothetical protein
MIKKIAAPFLFIFVFLTGCQEDPDPLPQTIDTYQYYYNYITEAFDLQWEIDGEVIGSGHTYGIPAEGVIQLDQVEQEVLFQTRNPDTGLMLDSLSCLLYENGFYMLAQLGSEQEPHLLCKALDSRPPTSGMVKYHFMHAAASMDPVDIYIGGDQPEDKVLSGLDYSSVSEYLETTEERLWTAILVTPANTLPADSTILSYTVNTLFQICRTYLCTIGHSENSIESSYQMQVDEHPVF